MSAHVPEQSRVSAGQAQLLAVRSCVAVQAFAHVPQFFSSLVASMQGAAEVTSF